MTDPSALVGATLGPYELQALLGSGGMASVYRALDRNLLRPVAVKVLAPALAADPSDLARFRREAQLIASLRHPNVVQIYALGEHQGLLYMVQELLPGPTLDQQLADLRRRGRRVERRDALAIVHDLAAALDAAHAVGVIHRDVKPGNAIANAQGRMVLTDFGIARSDADPSLTTTGIVLGTPYYVAPEQASGSGALTSACDIYALGVVAFELLAGRRPFEADTPAGLLLKHLYEPPPAPSALRPDLPPTIDGTVLRALEKEPAARFPSAGAFAQALAAAWPEDVTRGLPVPPVTIHSQPTRVWAGRPAPPAPLAVPSSATAAASYPPARRSRWLLPILGAALIVALAAGALLAARGQGDSPAAIPSPPAASPLAPTAAPSPPPATPPATAEPTAPPATAAPPTAAPPPTALAVAADPLLELGALITAGLSDGSAGADAPEYLQRYGELAQAIGQGDDKKADEQIRELSRKIAERDREGKLDAAFNARAQALLVAVAEQYGLNRPPGRGGDD